MFADVPSTRFSVLLGRTNKKSAWRSSSMVEHYCRSSHVNRQSEGVAKWFHPHPHPPPRHPRTKVQRWSTIGKVGSKSNFAIIGNIFDTEVEIRLFPFDREEKRREEKRERTLAFRRKILSRPHSGPDSSPNGKILEARVKKIDLSSADGFLFVSVSSSTWI